MKGVSVVVPVYDGERHLRGCLDALLALEHSGPLEVVVVDDGSRDRSRAIASEAAERGPVRVIDGPGRGAAAAINAGFAAAGHPLVAQVDQDVVVDPGWLAPLVVALDADERVAAAQGHYRFDPRDGVWGQVTGLDLARRYAALPADDVDHVCTGNSVYRKAAVEAVGGFDESYGYGYDNDMSYRLGEAGYRLVIRGEARSVHRVAPGLWAYCRRQYGQGYGRLDLVAGRPRRVRGDHVSGPLMMLHAPVTLGSLGAFAAAGVAAPWAPAVAVPLALAGAGGLGLLALERAAVGTATACRRRAPVGLLFPLVHGVRDLAWSAAIVVWASRRLRRRSRAPGQSMFRQVEAQPGPDRPRT